LEEHQHILISIQSIHLFTASSPAMARRAKSGTPGGAEAQDADAGQATEGAPTQGGAAVSEEKTSTKRKRKSTLDWRHVEEPGKFQGKFRICPIKVTGKRRKVDIAAFLDTGDENSPNQIQRSPFENTSLGDSPYRVEPSKTWLAMSKYKRFTRKSCWKSCTMSLVDGD
jgi:hypothetical protein